MIDGRREEAQRTDSKRPTTGLRPRSIAPEISRVDQADVQSRLENIGEEPEPVDEGPRESSLIGRRPNERD